MKAVRFHTVVGEDQVIRIPSGSLVPAGAVEVIVLQPEERPAANELLPEEPSGQTPAPKEHLFDRLARIAEELGIDDLPEDLSENHDYYAHGAPKGIDKL
jgi:hypothetical protein